MKIFLSWAGPRSADLAVALCDWLPTVNDSFHPWMSARDAPKGEEWFKTLGGRLSESRCGIVCVTPESTESRWLHFESGALWLLPGGFKVCPLLFGINPEDIDGPLKQFQLTTFAKDDVRNLVRALNRQAIPGSMPDHELDRRFDLQWPELQSVAERIAKTKIAGASLRPVLEALQGNGFPKPAIGRVVCFSDRFESHDLYRTVFEIARERVWIFGRKNRKVFDKNHWQFFKSLQSRPELDVRCLFVSPSAPAHILDTAHTDADFRDQLTRAIEDCLKTLTRCGVSPDRICRVYTAHRSTSMVVVDDSVLFRTVDYNSAGKALELTNTNFEVMDATFGFGNHLVSMFRSAWEAATPISQVIRK